MGYGAFYVICPRASILHHCIVSTVTCLSLTALEQFDVGPSRPISCDVFVCACAPMGKGALAPGKVDYHIRPTHEMRGKNRSRQRSSRNYCTEIYLSRGSAADPGVGP